MVSNCCTRFEINLCILDSTFFKYVLSTFHYYHNVEQNNFKVVKIIN